ncbi:Hypothetical protein SMAX5B_010191 [Scophthalmus maximus]|uniref:Uncharacterized protein n=1 Tax=Scophthalmus maximus TaxID=52904 RepID=A0A2U9B5F2_SCOMX|nr:Hypothetical protein SMAX5B_010191 [Scophthalmus maximus]
METRDPTCLLGKLDVRQPLNAAHGAPPDAGTGQRGQRHLPVGRTTAAEAERTQSFVTEPRGPKEEQDTEWSRESEQM